MSYESNAPPFNERGVSTSRATGIVAEASYRVTVPILTLSTRVICQPGRSERAALFYDLETSRS